MTDYSDPETPFPRLEVRIQKRESDTYWLQIWLHEEAGGARRQIENGKRSGSFRDAHERVAKCAADLKAFVDADDITVNWPEMERD